MILTTRPTCSYFVLLLNFPSGVNPYWIMITNIGSDFHKARKEKYTDRLQTGLHVWLGLPAAASLLVTCNRSVLTFTSRMGL